MFEKKCTNTKNAFELWADFYVYVLVDVTKLLFKQAEADPQQPGNHNGAIDFIATVLLQPAEQPGSLTGK